MAKTESVLFKLGADVSGLTRGLAQGRAGLKDLEKGAEGLTSKLVGLAGVLGVGIGLGAAAGEALHFADAIMKVTQQTGLSTDAAQRLAYFATQTGSSLEAVTATVGKMQENLVKAADGTDKQAEAFKSLGINTETFFRLNPDEQLMEVAKGMEAIHNPADKAAVAVAALGKSGKDSIPMLHEMATKGEELNAQFERMGGPMSKETIEKLDAIGDAASTAGQGVRNFAGEILALAAPAIIGALQGITTFFAALRHGISGGSDELATVTGQIEEIQSRIARGPGFRQPAEAWATNKKALEGELALLMAKEQALIDAPYKEAQAKIAAAKIAPDPAQELADIVVHAEERRKTKLDADLLEKQELFAQQQEWDKIVQDDIRDHEEEVTAITLDEMDLRAQLSLLTMGQQVANVSDKLIQMTASTAQHSKAMFAINKAASLAKATLDGWESIQSSWKYGSALGGPPLGVAFAAVAAAATGANIQAIARTQFNGGGAGVAPSNATQPATPVTPAGGGGGGGGGGGDRVMTVQGIQASALFDGKTTRLIAEQLLAFQKDGGQVVFES